MAFFKYKAYTKDGKASTGLVEAATEEQAAKLLKDKELIVASLSVSGEGALTGSFAKFQKVGFSDIVNFTRQMSTMITAGLSIPQSLAILGEQTTNPTFAKVISEIEHQIVGGGNLGDSLSKYPAYFSSIYVSLIRAGEASGLLDKVLTRLAETLESEREFRAKVVGAMIYPAIIVIGMVVVVAVMMIVVMPKLQDLYKDFNLELPVTTKILMGISNFFVQKWWVVILGAFGTGYAFSRWRKTALGERLIDTYMLKIPLFGTLQKKSILVEFTRTLAMLLASGIHILDALRVLKDSLGNVIYRDAVDDITKRVEKGFSLGDTFSSHKEFPPIVSQMIKVGEETGKMDDTLAKLSTYFQSETENLVKGLTTAIEPIIMVILGVGVGFIVFSVITPIYNLTAQFK
jgi:type II secretory pathway component PulF